MAEDSLVTNIVAKSNFSDLVSDLNLVSSRLVGLQQELNNTNKMLAAQAAAMQKAFSATMRSTGQFSTHFVSLQSDVEKFGKSLDSGKMKLGQYYNAWKEHSRTAGGLVRDLAAQQVRLQNAILQPLGKNAQGLMQFNVHIPEGLDKIANKTKLARQEMLIMNKVVQDGANQVINWGKNTQWAGRQLTMGLTLPLAMFGKAAADAFKLADQELVRLTKVYGGVAATSSADLKKIRNEVAQTAKDLASTYGAAYNDTIALAADIAATGKTGNELLKATQETTRLSILGEVDRQEAMKATLSIQTAFGQNTKELAESINFLNAVENQTSTSLADLVEAIPKAGPVVKSLGGDIQDLALYLTAMREGGVNASEGANALKSALASIINPTKVAKDMFNGLGIDLGGIVTRNAGNLTGTILEMQSALSKLDPLQKSQAIEQLFGKFQFARMNALFENLGKQGSQTLQVLDLMKASSEDLANIAGRELSQITESASGKYKRAVESLKANMAGIGEQFLGIATRIINIVDAVIKFVNKLPDPIKSVLGLVGGLTALSGPLIMLTGLLANFFGYVAKGLFHFRALFKGGQGFRLLTPEILAAEQAGSLLETQFYSDAKAAATLKGAISNLTAELTLLETKANSARVAVGPAITTIAGNVVAPGATGRIVDPAHPLVGDPYTRASGHMNPVSKMSESEKLAQTIFGMTPAPIPVNRSIGATPQIYADAELPVHEGLTSVKGVSTGVVASEAAKWHAMTGAIAVQSQQEIAELKTEVAATGTITSSLSQSYKTLLPQMTDLTSMAAEESRLIVGQLNAGKITVEAARAKIMQLNATVETMMAETVAQLGSSRGVTAAITTVPLTNQPVVDPTTGKSNMKEMFHKSKTSAMVDKIARILGVRTSGGGYSIETTKPIRRNSGGEAWVPGNTSVNKDVVPAMLTPGEFVIRQSVAQSDPEGMRMLNDGEGMIVPVQNRNAGGFIQVLKALASRRNGLSGVRTGARSSGAPGRSARNVHSSEGLNYEAFSRGRIANAGLPRLTETGAISAEEKLLLSSMVGAHGSGRDFQAATGLRSRLGSYPVTTVGNVPNIYPNLSGSYRPDGRSRNAFERQSDLQAQILPGSMVHMPGSFNTSTALGGASRSSAGVISGFQMTNLMDFLVSRGMTGRDARVIADTAARRLNSILPKNGITEDVWSRLIVKAEQGAIVEHKNMLSSLRLNSGGNVPGYIRGGMIPALSKAVSDRLTAKWPAQRSGYQPGFQYKLGNQDPLHGPLQIGMSSAMNRWAGYDPNNYALSRRVNYRDDKFNRITSAEQFLHGTLEERGKYATAQYMQGNLDIMSQMERLGNHPLGPIAAMKSQQKKFTGKLFRGLKMDKTFKGLPEDLIEAIRVARATGDTTGLINKEFIMRRSSWSKDKGIASFFAPGSKVDPESLLIEASVKNRNILPAGDMFPDQKFTAPYGQDWSGGKLGQSYRSEQEAIFGGKFRVVGFKDGRLQVETVVDGARAKGGPVNAGRPYLVGENGPEVFVPRNSGGIVPNNMIQKRGAGGSILKMILPMIAGQMASSTASSMGAPDPGGMTSMLSFMGGAGVASAALNKVMPAVSETGDAAANAAASTSKFGNALKFVSTWGSKIPGWGKVAALVIVAVAAAGKKLWDISAKARQASADAILVNKKEASELGIAYTNIGDKLSKVYKDVKAQRALMLANASTATQYGGGISMTVKEFNSLKKAAKETTPSIVEMFNSLKSEDVADAAVALKTQLVAAGKSASEAAKQIFAILSVSNKSGQAITAVSSNAFMSIINKASAAKTAMKTFNNAMEVDADKVELTNAFEAALSTMDSYYSSLVGTKDATGKVITETDALNLTIEELSKNQKANNKIGEDTYETLVKQNPALLDIISSTDTLTAAWAKMHLYTQGVAGDLSDLSGKDAINMSKALNAIGKAATDLTTKIGVASGGLGQLAVLYNKLKTESENDARAAEAAAKAAQRNADKEIAAIDKKIKKIQEEAEARRAAIEQQQNLETFNNSLKQEQIKYQDALATGSMSEAAQAQIRIQQLTQEEQKRRAIEAINEKEKRDVAALETKKLGIQESIANAQERAATAAEKAAKSAEKFGKINTIQQNVANIISQASMFSPGSGMFKTLSKNLQSEVASLSLLGPEGASAAKALTPEAKSVAGPQITTPGGQKVDTSSTSQDWVGQLKSYVQQDRVVAKGYFDKFGGDVDSFGKYVSALTGRSLSGNRPGEGEYQDVKWYQDAGEGDARDISYLHFKYNKKNYVSRIASNEYEEAYKFAKAIGATGLKWNKYRIEGWTDVGFNAGNSKKPFDSIGLAMGGAIPGYSTGRMISGPGTPTSDSILARLSRGEYVVKAGSVSDISPANMQLINSLGAEGVVRAADNIMGRAMGGAIPGYSLGGRLDTRFASMPNSSGARSFSPSDYRMQQSSEKVYHIAPVINAAPGMDENAIADIATRRMLDALRIQQYNESRANGVGRLV